MDYLLDSDIASIFYDSTLKEDYESIRSHVSALTDEDVLQTSILVIYELQYSFFNAPSEKRAAIKDIIDRIITQDFVIVPLDQIATARIYGEIKARLKQEKGLDRNEMRRHNIDIMLAAMAIGTSSVLIGGDHIYEEIQKFRSDFKYENWLKQS